MSIIRDSIRGLAPRAMFDPLPGPGVQGALSDTGSASLLGSFRMVDSFGVARWTTYREIYLTNPWVFAAVNKHRRSLARMPLNVATLDQDGVKSVVNSDLPQTPGRPAGALTLDKVLKTPLGGLSRGAMVSSALGDRLVYGNGLWELVRDGRVPAGLPLALKRIRWRYLTHIEQDSDGFVLYYEFREPKREPRRLGPQDVVHFGYGSDGEGALGVSPLESCRYTLALHDAVVRHLIAYFGNAGRPSGAFKVDRLTPDRAREIRQLITELYASPENAGKIIVTSGEWQPISDQLQTQPIIDLIHNSREEIVAVYAVPPTEVGILDRAIKSNAKEMRQSYFRDGLGPWAAELEQELTTQLLTQVPSWSSGVCVDFDMAEALRPDLEALALVLQRLSFVYTIDDSRQELGLQPLRIKGVTDVPWSIPGSQPMSANATGRAAKPPPDTGYPSAESNGHRNGHDELEGLLT